MSKGREASLNRALIQALVSKEPLDMLEALFHMSTEIGEDINKELRCVSTEEEGILHDALTRLHGQACLLGHEILTLMRCGYADGAYSRWRSMHEVVVFAEFIQKNGAEVAERYLNHTVIESFRALNEYQKYQQRLKLTPFPQAEVERISEKRKQLIKEYGKLYEENYGWASSTLNNPNPRFADIEKAVNYGHFRPYYRLTSHHTHSNPKSVLFKLGTLGQTRSMILAGASNGGLAEPGQGMAISLGQIDTLLLRIKPSITGIITGRVINRWVDDLCKKFIEVHRIVEKRWGKSEA